MSTPPLDATSTKPPQIPTPLNSLKSDFSAGVVVFLVAVPLCLGIAGASGAPLLSGLIAGVIGGVLVALISGSQISVSGPAAGLVVIVASAITTLGSFDAFLVAVLLAGVLQVLFGVLRLGVIGEYVPNSVIKGMMAGIGLVIILKQIPHALGRDTDYAGDHGFSQLVDGENTFSEIILASTGLHPLAVLISCVCLAILITWESAPIKGSRLSRILPGPFVAIISGSLLAKFGLPYDPALGEVTGGTGGHFVNLPVYASFSELLSSMRSPDWSALLDRKVWGIAGSIAVVASIESLLSIEASDKLDPYRRITSNNRELIAQGTGNIAAGLLGGLPITAVVVRSSTNVYAGGRTKMSAIAHGVLIALAAAFFPTLLNLIPLASLATILIAVGYKLTPPKLYKRMWRDGATQFGPFIVTVLGIIFTDLLTGVMMGLALGLYFVVKTNHHAAVTIVHDGEDYLLRFNKDISFVNKAELKEALASIPDNSRVLFDGTKSMFIDHDIYDMLKDFNELAGHRGITIRKKNIIRKSLPITFKSRKET
jgi:MFS superfamily sulfate permease-like transporter